MARLFACAKNAPLLSAADAGVRSKTEMVQHVEVKISDTLTTVEWKTLESFCEKANRLATTKLGSGSEPRIQGKMRYEQDRGMWFEATLPPEEQIAEFLLSFRFFYLEKESTHFPKVLNIIGKHSDNGDARKALKIFGKQWRDCLFGNALNITFNETPMTSSLLIDLWFNAHYFHSDELKQDKLEKIKEGFTEDFAKYMLLDAVFECSKIVFKVYYGMKDLISDRRNS